MVFSLPRQVEKWAFLSIALFCSQLSIGQVAQEYKTIHVKFKETHKPSRPINGKVGRLGIDGVDRVNETHQSIFIKRIFPDAGIYEAAHQAFGLHLWYEVRLPKEANVKTALNDYRATEYFEAVEESLPYAIDDPVNTAKPEKAFLLPDGSNDPNFVKQWHFENTGQSGGTPGADIKLKEAWKKETGSPNVIVAIIDGGIAVDHPDLKDALWTNAAEIPGNGKDDDRNGYIDDIHGYGFGDQSPVIYADQHGTHVAGTIGASSNNGIGVAGIAGGNGTDKGVRLMSCAGFGAFNIGGFEEAMVYAADNGAVISQNSWRGGSTAIEAAIDYFVARAGLDNRSSVFSKNIQTGPMAGGVVIFAAGNENFYYGYPASYNKVIAVASTDHNDVRSYFSNYGPWVDISAPGSNVYSTKVIGYDYMTGTSMACPHVSGVAALIVSNLQRNGMKPSEVWNRLRFSSRLINTENPDYVNKLGWGRLDASIALMEPDQIIPGPINSLETINIRSTSVTLRWNASGADNDLGQAAEYEIRYSKNPIDETNFAQATLIKDPPTPPPSGEQVVLKIEKLSPVTQYYFAIRSMDLFNNVSLLSNVAFAITLKPATPEIVTTELSEQLYTGTTSVKKITVKNIGEEDGLFVRLGVPHVSPAKVSPPLGAKGRLFGINTFKSKIEELDTKTGKVLLSIDMPVPSTRVNEGLAFDGVNIYYGNSSVIYKINLETGARRSFNLTNASSIVGMAWSGEYLFVSYYEAGNARPHKMSMIDTDNGKIIKTTEIYSELAFYPKNRSLLLATGFGLQEFNPDNDNVIRVINPALNPKCIAYSYIDDVIFISDDTAPQIKAIRPTDGTVIYTIPYPSTTALAGDEFNYSWVETTDEVISIAAGHTGELPVTFNSAGISGLVLSGSINIFPLDGGLQATAQAKQIPVSLNVLPAADIETAKKIDFGKRFVGFPIDTTFIVENRGTADLVINEMSSNDPHVSISKSSATIIAGQKIEVTVSVQSDAPRTTDAMITMNSNDPDEGTVTIPVKAIIEGAPVINVSTDTIKVSLRSGESTSVPLALNNPGGSSLFWRAEFTGSQSDSNARISQEENNGSVESVQAEEGELILKASSPEWVTGLVYDPKREVVYAKSLLGSNFYVYDISWNKWKLVGLSAPDFQGQGTYLNGKAYFGGSKLNVYHPETEVWSSVSFPISGSANSITNDDKYIYVAIAKVMYRYDPLSQSWFELPPIPGPLYMNGVGSLSYQSGVIYATGTQGIQADGNTLFFKYFIGSNSWIRSSSIEGIVSLSAAAIHPTSAKYFTAGTAHSGEAIKLSILDIRSGERSATATPFAVGGLVYVNKGNESGIYMIQAEGTKLGVYKTSSSTNWLTLSPESGTVLAGETQNISINLNAQGLFGGRYFQFIRLFTGNPKMEKRIPLQLDVVGVPGVSLSRSEVDVGNIVIGSSSGAGVTIRNSGSAELVSTVSVDNPDAYFYSTPGIPITSFSIPVGEAKTFSVNLKPTELGQQTGTFTFHSNTSGTGEFQFTIHGTAVGPAILEIPTDTIKFQLFSGETAKHKFVIQNTGSGDTQYLTLWGTDSWIKVKTDGYAQNISAHESREFEVFFNANGLSQGVYKSVIWIEDHMDAGYDHFEIPVQLTVTDAPFLSLSKDSLDFGNQFINASYQSTVQIMNTGTLPLLISSITSDNSKFSITPMTALTVYPQQMITMNVRFNPVSVSSEVCHLVFTTNQPNNITQTFIIKGNGVIPPSLQANRNEIIMSAFDDEMRSDAITFSNDGGSKLKMRIDNQSISQQQSFIRRLDTPVENGLPINLTAITTDPATGLVYAQYAAYQSVYSYNPRNNTWAKIGNGPVVSANAIGGSAFLNSKMYSVFSDDSLRIHVYDMILKEWTTKSHEFTLASSAITTDGVLLYVAGSRRFASYNPKTNSWTVLNPPNFILDGLGGLSFLDGNIYAHAANSNSFARYNIASGIWETLIPVPGKAISGSTVDAKRKRYYAYGETYLYEFDIEANTWNVSYIPFFDIGHFGGLTYSAVAGFEGVYFSQGDYGRGFAKYEPKNVLSWLRTSHLIGEVESHDLLTIGVSCNAKSLTAGVYHGSVQVASNDPTKANMAIPVTFTVRNSKPTIKAPALLTDSVERSAPTVFSFVIENIGRDSLIWSLSNSLPAWLSANKSSGRVGGTNSESVEVTFKPSLFPTGAVADYTLDINSNDPASSKTSVRVLAILRNKSPKLKVPIANQMLANEPVEIQLSDYFVDPDNDALNYTVSADKIGIVTTQVIGNKLTIKPVKSGALTVTVKATDPFSASTTTNFNVNTVVTGLEKNGEQKAFTLSPNPFKDKFTIQYDGVLSGHIRIVMIDFTGRAIWSSEETANAQDPRIELSGSAFPRGLYICNFYVNNKLVSSEKVVKE